MAELTKAYVLMFSEQDGWESAQAQFPALSRRHSSWPSCAELQRTGTHDEPPAFTHCHGPAESVAAALHFTFAPLWPHQPQYASPQLEDDTVPPTHWVAQLVVAELLFAT